jgi:hypothetical protein
MLLRAASKPMTLARPAPKRRRGWTDASQAKVRDRHTETAAAAIGVQGPPTLQSVDMAILNALNSRDDSPMHDESLGNHPTRGAGSEWNSQVFVRIQCVCAGSKN